MDIDSTNKYEEGLAKRVNTYRTNRKERRAKFKKANCKLCGVIVEVPLDWPKKMVHCPDCKLQPLGRLVGQGVQK